MSTKCRDSDSQRDNFREYVQTHNQLAQLDIGGSAAAAPDTTGNETVDYTDGATSVFANKSPPAAGNVIDVEDGSQDVSKDWSVTATDADTPRKSRSRSPRQQSQKGPRRLSHEELHAKLQAEFTSHWPVVMEFTGFDKYPGNSTDVLVGSTSLGNITMQVEINLRSIQATVQWKDHFPSGATATPSAAPSKGRTGVAATDIAAALHDFGCMGISNDPTDSLAFAEPCGSPIGDDGLQESQIS